MMIHRLHWLFRQYMAPTDGGEGGGGGGGDDRGDNVDAADDNVDDTKGEKVDDADETKDDDKGDKDDADDETKDEDDKGDDKAKDKKVKDTRIPLSRHKAVLEKERTARQEVERQLAAERAGKAVADTNKELTESEDKLLKLEGELTKLVTDGETEKAATKMAEIRKLERSIVEQRAEFKTQAAEARAYERVRYDMTLERLEEAYPVINQDHDDYDEDKANEVVELMQGYVATGKYSRSEALQKSVKVLLGQASKKQEDATEVKPRVDKTDVADELAKERKKAALAKNADTANKQPASTAKLGQDSDKHGKSIKGNDVMKMSQDEFAKLDEKTLAQMRGDEVEA